MSRKTVEFLLLTFAINWAMVALYQLAGWPWSGAGPFLLATSYMLVPAIVAWIVQRRHGERVKGPLGIRWTWNRWFTISWLGTALVALLTVGVGLLLPDVRLDLSMTSLIERLGAQLTPEQLAQLREQAAHMPIHPFWLALIQGMIAGVTVNAVFAFGEELGWRGLLQREWAPMGFWRSSLLIGLVWGLWHAPLILKGHNYPQHPVAGVGMMVVFCLLLSPLFGYLRLRSGSVLAAAVAHGTLNGTAGLSAMVLAGGNDLMVSVTGLAGFVVLAAANLLLYWYDRQPDVSALSEPQST